MKRIFLLLALALAGPMLSRAADRDPAGIELLVRVAAASGWTARNLPVDVLAEGTVTAEGKPPGSLTLKVKGRSSLRVERDREAVTIRTGRNAVTKSDGAFVRVPSHGLSSTASWSIPFLTPLTNWNDQAQCVGPPEAASLDGHGPTTKIVLGCSGPDQLTAWIDEETLLPLQLQYAVPTISNPNILQVRTLRFGDYRQVNGLWFPFAQRSSTQNLVYDIRFTTVLFNVGLTDADFEIPAVELTGDWR